MDKECDCNMDGSRTSDPSSLPWSGHPPQLSATNFRISQSAESDQIDAYHLPFSDNCSDIFLPVQLSTTTCRTLKANSKSFLPQDQLHAHDSTLAKQELRIAMSKLPESVLDRYTTAMFAVTVNNASNHASLQNSGFQPSNQISGLKPRILKPLKVLVLISKVDTIPSFISAEPTNFSLLIDYPHFLGEQTSLAVLLKRCFHKWTVHEVRTLTETQWVVSSPFLGTSAGDVSVHDFLSQTLLSSFNDDTVTTPYVNIDDYNNVEIHRQHHNYDHRSNQYKLYFAPKESLFKRISEFQREVAVLGPYEGSPHACAVNAPVAFRHGILFYLLFPWLEGPKTYSFSKDRRAPTLNPSPLRRIHDQCLETATAPRLIHHAHHPAEACASCYRYHRDIKPKPIFSLKEGSQSGSLFWTPSKSVIEVRYPQLGTDRSDPPIEFLPTDPDPKLGMKGVANGAHDVWSLRCVPFKLLTRLFYGWKGVGCLSPSQIGAGLRASKVEWKDFGFLRMAFAGQGASPKVQLKASIILWINTLAADRTESRCTTDWLDQGRTELLDTNRETSASISRVTEKLQCLRQRCLEDPAYTVALPRPRKPPWSTRMLRSLHQDKLPAPKNSAQSTYSNMSQLQTSSELDAIEQMTVPPQSVYWSSFEEHGYNTNHPGNLYNYAINEMAHIEGASDGYQASILPSSQPAQPLNPSVPTQTAHKSLNNRRRTIDSIDNSNTGEQRKKKARKKGTSPIQDAFREAAGDKTVANPSEMGSSKSPRSPETTAGDRLFACPFFKRNPARYSTKAWKACTVVGGRTIPRLKEHIYRNHCSSGHRCDRCFAEFKDRYELQQHRRTEPPCRIRDANSGTDTIDEVQREEIQRKLRGISDEEKWRKMYRIIFKLDPTAEVPSPYQDIITGEPDPGKNKLDNAISLPEFQAFLHRRLHLAYANGQQDDIAGIKNHLELIHQFQQEVRAQELAVEPVPSEAPPLTSDYLSDDATGASESQDFPPLALMASANDDGSGGASGAPQNLTVSGAQGLIVGPYWGQGEVSFAAQFSKAFLPDGRYGFPETLNIGVDDGRAPSGG